MENQTDDLLTRLNAAKARLESKNNQQQAAPQSKPSANPLSKYWNKPMATAPTTQDQAIPAAKPAQQPAGGPTQYGPVPGLGKAAAPAEEKSFFGNIADGFKAGLPQMLGNMAQGVAEFTDMIPSIAATAPAMGIPTATTGFDKFAPAYKAELEKQAKGESKPALPAFRDFAKGQYDKADKVNEQADPESWGYMVGSLAPQAAGIATAVGVGAVNPAAGMALGLANTGALGTMAAGSAAKEYDNYVAEKGIEVNPNDKLGSMMLSMAAESASEAIPVAKFIPKAFKGQMAKFIFGNTEVAAKKGAQLLEEFANTNASRKQLVQNLLRETSEGALTEGPTESVAELGNEFSTWLYKEKEDRATFSEMGERALKAMAGGAIMGAGIGPLSYGAQQVQNQRRRQEAGKVVLAQDKATGEAIEIMGVANPSKKEDGTSTGPAIYQAIRPNGKVIEIDENNVGAIIELPLGDFDGLLKGKGKAMQDQQMQKISEATQQAQSVSDEARAKFEPMAYQGPDGIPMISGAKYNGEDVYVTQLFPNGSAVIQKPGEDKQVVKQDGLTEMDTRPFEDFISTFAPPPAQTAPAIPLDPIQVGEPISSGGAKYVVTGIDEESGIVQLENEEDPSDLPMLPIDQFNQLREQSKAEQPVLAGEESGMSQDPAEETPANQLRKIFGEGEKVDLGGVETTEAKQTNKLPKATPESSQQYRDISGLIERKLGTKFDFAPIGLQNEVRTTWMKDFLAKNGGEIGQELADIIEFPAASLRFLNNLPDAAQPTAVTEPAGLPADESPSLQVQPASEEQAGLGQSIAPDAPAQPVSEGVDTEVPVVEKQDKTTNEKPVSTFGIPTTIEENRAFLNWVSENDITLKGKSRKEQEEIALQWKNEATNQPQPSTNDQLQQAEPDQQAGQENVQEPQNQENSTQEVQGQEGLVQPGGVTPAPSQYPDLDQAASGDELSSLYDAEVQNMEGVSPKDSAIADHIGKVDPDSFARFGDRNTLTKGMSGNWIAKKGQGKKIDLIAQEASEQFTPGNTESISPQDVVDFLGRYSSAKEVTTPKGNPKLKAIQDKHIELTGKGLNRKTALSKAKASKALKGKSVNKSDDGSLLETNEQIAEYLANNPDILDFLSASFGEQGETLFDIGEVNWQNALETLDTNPGFFTGFPGSFTVLQLDKIKTIINAKLNEQAASNTGADSAVQADPEPDQPTGNADDQQNKAEQADEASTGTDGSGTGQEPDPADADNPGEAVPAGSEGTGSDIAGGGVKEDLNIPQTFKSDLYVKLGKQQFPINSFEEASKKQEEFLSRLFENTEFTEDTYKDIQITDKDGKVIAYISQNGRVWEGEKWKMGGKNNLLYDPIDGYTDYFKSLILDGNAPKPKPKPKTAKELNQAIAEKPAKKTKQEEVGILAKEELQDVGEKIGGAKKDVWAPVKVTLEAIKSEPLSKVFPKPDFKKLVESGQITQDNAIFLRYLYESIPTKPRGGYKMAQYEKSVSQAVTVTNNVIEDGISGFNMAKAVLDKARVDVGSNFEIYYQTMKQLGFPENPANVGNAKVVAFFSKEGVEYAVKNGPKWVDNKRFKTLPEAIDHLQQFTTAKKEAPKYTKMSVYKDGVTKEYFIGKKGAVGVVRVMDGFKTGEEAFKFRDENQDQLQAVWDEMKSPVEERRAYNRNRIGTDWRKGENVSAESFKNTFGFRGVEFGNWVNTKERQDSVNDAYDALMDLSAILNVDPKALSLNGELGFAFGARGSGKAMAHYEPDKVVINLTKTKGAGSLAHEWWHAIDNYFGKKRGYAGSFLSDSPTQGRKKDGTLDTSVRLEMLQAFKGINTAIKKTELGRRSSRLDSAKSTPYWSTIVEMTARSFENYVIEKMGESSQLNDYLANFKEMAEWISDTKGNVSENNFPYPTKEESPVINEAYDQFFQTVKVDEADPNKAMFMIIGGRGASSIDKSQQTDTRLNHWRLAKQMEKLGEPADAIRMSTGWERGADGKWRYEIQDGEWKDLDKVLELMLGDSDQTVKLSDIYDNQEFYEAYPEAGDIQVTFSPDGQGAFFDARDTSITLQGSEFRKRFKGKSPGEVFTATNDLRGLRSVLAHELTHYIQEKEFFAKGASPQFFEGMQALSEEMRTEYLSYTDDIDLVISEAEARDISISEAFKLATGIFEPKAEKQVARYVEEYKDKPLAELKKRVKEDRNYLRSPLEKYYAAMGEAEARNVEKRLDMTPWERLVNTIESTEYDATKVSMKNVAREDQIKITKGGISKSIDRPTTAADLNKLFTAGKAQEMIEAPKGPKQTTKAGEIAKKAADFTKGWNNAPEIITLNSPEEARARFPELEANYSAEDLSNVPAIFLNDPQTGKPVAVLIASHSYLSEKGGVERAILHEVIGHYGLREFLKQQADGDKAQYVKAFSDLMGQIFDAKQGAALMTDIAKRYFNKPVSELEGQEKLIAADEYIAHLAQSGVEDAWIDRVVAKLRQILRELGMKIGLSDAEVRALIGNSMRVVRGPQGMPMVREGVDQSNVPQFMVQEGNSDQTQSEAFKKWFKDSKVVDENGQPLVVYHGTGGNFDTFDLNNTGSNTDSGMLGKGFYFSDSPETASSYAKRGKTPNVLPVYLSLQNPFVTSDLSTLPQIAEPQTLEEMAVADITYSKELREKLISMGYDGVIFNTPDGKQEIVAFNPTQIKSATGNSGDFNPDNADIRFMKTGATNADFSAVNTKNYSNAQLSWFERKFIEPLQDRMVRSKKLIQARTDGKVSDKADFYTKENLASGKTLEKARRFEKDLWNPLIKTANELFNANQVSPEEISNYLKFKHHAERKAYFIAEYEKLDKKIPTDDKWPTGMTDEEAADGIAAFEAKADPTLTKKLRRQVHKVNQFTTFERYKSGMITKEVFKDLLTRYKNYVPLTDWKGMEDTNDKVYTLLMSAKGRTSEAADPLPFLFTAAQESIMRGENNRVRRSVLEFVKENVSPSNYFIRSAYYLNTKSQDEFGNDIWIETMNKPSDTQIQAGEAMRSFNPEVHRNVQQQGELTNILPVMVSGKKVFIEFKDKEIPSTIKNINQDKLPYILDKWRNFTRWLSSMYTQYSPEFGIRNLIRDVGFGTFNILVEQDVTTAAKTIKGMHKSAATLGKFFKNNDYPKGKVGDMLKEFMEEGAMTGYSDLQTAADVFARAKKEIQRADKLNLWQAGGRAVAAPLKVAGEYLEVYNKMLENAMRFSYYQTLREAGLTKQKAAAKAKDLTVNFNRKGRASSVMGSLFIFFNASVQGSERLIRSFTNPRTRKKALGLGGTIMAAGLMQSLLYGLSDEEDEDGRTFYEKIPDYTRRNNIILPNFFTEDGNDFLKIPLPYGLNVFHSFGESLGQVLTGKKSIGQESLGMVSAMTNVFSPIGGIELGKDDSDGFYDALSLTLPSVMQPMLDLGFNRNFAGRQIYRENFASNQYQLPDSQMYFEGVNPIIREATDFANKLTGGNEVIPGAVDINPEWVEHGIDQYLGGPAQFAKNMSNTVINLSQGENVFKDPFLRSTPFVRSYVDKTGTDYQARSEFYENRDNAVRAAEAYEEMLQAGLQEDANEWYREKEDLIILADEFKSFEKDIKSLTKTINELKKEDKELFDDDIAKLIDERTLYMREYNKRFGERIYKKRPNPIKDLINRK